MEDGELDGSKVTLNWAKPKDEGGSGGLEGGQGGSGCHREAQVAMADLGTETAVLEGNEAK